MTPPTEPLATVNCPLCHTAAPSLTAEALAGGADWRCPQCHQNWSAGRFATVAAYARFCTERSLGQDRQVRSDPHFTI